MSSRGATATIRWTLTALDDARTVRYGNARTGRREISEAVSVCGRWLYAHQDMPGTPWIVIDQWKKDTKDEWFTSLDAACAWTAEQPDLVTAASLLKAARREAFDARDDSEDNGDAFSTDTED